MILALRLEQETVGNLVGASRSRVNAALRALVEDDRLREHAEGWLLCGERPRRLLHSSEFAGAAPAGWQPHAA